MESSRRSSSQSAHHGEEAASRATSEARSTDAWMDAAHPEPRQHEVAGKGQQGAGNEEHEAEERVGLAAHIQSFPKSRSATAAEISRARSAGKIA
jgi:hypothetical protein